MLLLLLLLLLLYCMNMPGTIYGYLGNIFISLNNTSSDFFVLFSFFGQKRNEMAKVDPYFGMEWRKRMKIIPKIGEKAQLETKKGSNFSNCAPKTHSIPQGSG